MTLETLVKRLEGLLAITSGEDDATLRDQRDALKQLLEYKDSIHKHVFSDGRNDWCTEVAEHLPVVRKEVDKLMEGDDQRRLGEGGKEVYASLRQLGRIFRSEFNMDLHISQSGLLNR